MKVFNIDKIILKNDEQIKYIFSNNLHKKTENKKYINNSLIYLMLSNKFINEYFNIKFKNKVSINIIKLYDEIIKISFELLENTETIKEFFYIQMAELIKNNYNIINILNDDLNNNLGDKEILFCTA